MSDVKKKIDPQSRDYDVKDVDIDPRFQVCRREFLFCCVIFVVFAAAMLFCVFVIGGGDPSNYIYILGIPQWYFAIVVVCVLTAVAVSILLDKCFRHMSLEADGELEATKKKDRG
ncbi:MAG: DUF997 family protein [Oscillospiraceae bacterium]|nr:DUF997 family protein [Oscillospiraceae bacterium]